MSEEPARPLTPRYRVVLVNYDGQETDIFVEQPGDQVAALVQRLRGTGRYREVRFEPATGERPKLFPPELWAAIDPLEVDNEVPPLDRPKIR